MRLGISGYVALLNSSRHSNVPAKLDTSNRDDSCCVQSEKAGVVVRQDNSMHARHDVLLTLLNLPLLRSY